MVAASRLKMSKSQESSFSMVWAMRGGMSLRVRGVARWLGAWGAVGGTGQTKRHEVQIRNCVASSVVFPVPVEVTTFDVMTLRKP